jgi:hypothetical protein
MTTDNTSTYRYEPSADAKAFWDHPTNKAFLQAAQDAEDALDDKTPLTREQAREAIRNLQPNPLLQDLSWKPA